MSEMIDEILGTNILKKRFVRILWVVLKHVIMSLNEIISFTI